MRIVHTTRGEFCIQIGRVQNGQLGELGIDGNFHDDDRFHLIPPDALPADIRNGSLSDGSLINENTFCQDSGGVLEFVHYGVSPSATAARGRLAAGTARELRDIAFGILGPHAVSISYRQGATHRIEAVAAPIGAYLVVQRAMSGELRANAGVYGGVGGATSKGAPEFADAPLTAITYRVGGRLCRSPGSPSRLALCRQPPPVVRARQRSLHVPLRLHLLVSHRAVIGATLSFTAPYAVTSANHDYGYAILEPPKCGGGQTGDALARNVRRNARITWQLPDPFAYSCGARSVTIDLRYGDGSGIGRGATDSVLVGSITVKQPPDTSAAPPANGPIPAGRGQW
jgi:hypothetical protein